MGKLLPPESVILPNHHVTVNKQVRVLAIQDRWAEPLPGIFEVVVELVPQPFVPRDIHNAQRAAVRHLAEALVLLREER